MRSIVAVSIVLLLVAPLAMSVALPGREVTLAGSAAVAAGGTGTFTGRIGTFGLRTPSAEVELFVDGAPVARTFTYGDFAFTHTFGGRAVHTLVAVADDGLPTRAQSPPLTVRVGVPPGAPQDVAVSMVDGAWRARVAWSAPADDGGAPVAQYRIERNDGPGWVLRALVQGGVREWTDTTGSMVVRSQYRVLASNVAGTGPASAPASAGGSAPLTPTISAVPLHHTFSVRVEVAPGGGATQQLRIERSFNGGASWHTTGTLGGAGGVFTDVNAFWTTPIQYRALARNLVGDSAPSAAIAPGGPLPGAPASLTATVSERLALEWTAPTSGGPVQQYALFDNGEPLEFSSGSPMRLAYWYDEFELWPELEPGTHVFGVAAVSAAGVGPITEAAPITLARASRPVGFTATLTEDGADANITLTWSAPLSDGGSPITGYTLTRPTGPPIQLGPNARSITFFAAHSQTYDYTLVARTLVGAGEAVSISVVVPDFDIAFTGALDRFRVCQPATITTPATCANVADGGTYTLSSATRQVRWTPVYEGLLTKRGAPLAGETVGGTILPEQDDELTTFPSATTDANGEYSMTLWDPLYTWSGGCRTLTWVGSLAGPGAPGVTLPVHSLTICP